MQFFIYHWFFFVLPFIGRDIVLHELVRPLIRTVCINLYSNQLIGQYLKNFMQVSALASLACLI
jgi:hypothetical protein